MFIYIYALIDGQYKKVLVDKQASRYGSSPCCNWKTTIERQSTGLLFDDLKLITKGDYCKQAFESEEEKNNIVAPKEVYSFIAKASSFAFTITKTYHFSNNRYHIINTTKHVYKVKKK